MTRFLSFLFRMKGKRESQDPAKPYSVSARAYARRPDDVLAQARAGRQVIVRGAKHRIDLVIGNTGRELFPETGPEDLERGSVIPSRTTRAGDRSSREDANPWLR
jgi:hypothetical protein